MGKPRRPRTNQSEQQDPEGNTSCIGAERDDSMLPLGINSSSVFLHTIPEGSSDVGAASSSFNPLAAAAASPLYPTGCVGGVNGNSSWTTMKNFRFFPTQSSAPDPPPSVASSTRAVEAGNAGATYSESGFNSDLGAVVGTGMDGSITARVGACDDGPEGAGTTRADRHRHPGNAVKPKGRKSFRTANKKKLGVVCLLTVLLVIGVIIALVFIVKSLGNAADDDDVASSFGESGTSPTSNTTGTTVPNPTLAPSQAETMMGTGKPTAELADNFDDDFDDGLPLTGETESLLELLDEAIVMLYTSDQQELNMLTHVSSEVFATYSSNSPRYRAREWLLNNDTLLQSAIANADAGAKTSSSSNQRALSLERIAQRYIMLVFYFATLDESDNNDDGSGNRRQRRRTERQSDSPEPASVKFSIDAETHECFWIDNACGQDDSVDTNYDSQQIANNQVADDAKIVYLNVSHAGLVGTLPFEVGYLTKLREITIHGNNLIGTLPDMLPMQLKYLYVLDLSRNSFEGSIPSQLWTLPTLRFAYLHGNGFSGTIPQSLPGEPSQELEEIWLRDNRLSGEIPRWWTELPSLDVLSVSNNSWTGPLPDDWTQASKLEFFDISLNNLTGTIPPSLFYAVPTLRHLYLDFNQLSGQLPTRNELAIDDLDFTITLSRAQLQMEAVWLQFNKLSGTIPKGFGNTWNQLKQLELQGNQFTGIWQCVEEGSNVWPRLEELSVDCFEGPSLETGLVPSSTAGNTGGGVDMTSCNVCCIKCF